MSALDITPPSEGPISLDQAVGLMRSVPAETVEREEEHTPEPTGADTDAEVSEHEESEGDPPPEEVHGEADEPNAEEDVEAVEPATAIDPPHWWSTEAKAKFADLPSDLQTVVLEQEKNRERATTQSQQKATDAAKLADEARSALEAQRTETAQSIERINAIAEKAGQVFIGRWDGATPEWWAKLAQDDPDAYVRSRATFDAESAQLQQVITAKQEADTKAAKESEQAESTRFAEWSKTESEALKTLQPELADPEKGPARLKELGEFLLTSGASPDQLKYADSKALSLLYDAMRYRKAQASVIAPKPKPVPAPARPAARPGASNAAPSKNRTVTEASSRLNKSGSIDDAVALLKAQRKAG